MLAALIVLGISTVLNAVYFMKTVIRIYATTEDTPYPCMTFKDMKPYAVVLVFFIIVNVILGVSSQPIVNMIEQGLAMFA